MHKYYTLVSQSYMPGCTDDWVIEFGAYEREDVLSELEDYKYRDKCDGLKIKYKIICTDDTQAEVNAAVDKLNNT